MKHSILQAETGMQTDRDAASQRQQEHVLHRQRQAERQPGTQTNILKRRRNHSRGVLIRHELTRHTYNDKTSD